MAAVQNGRQPSGVRLESSLEGQESSLDTTATSQDQASDDEDDELLALRIAALESIKIKEAKAKADAKKPEFLIKSHPARGNLVSIVTCEDELQQGVEVKQQRNGSKLSNRLGSPPPSIPAPVLPVFDKTRPPPGFASEAFVSEPLIPFPPPRRFSRSPRRWSRSPPPRRSPSPYSYRRRRSPSPLPLRRYRSRSPSPLPPRRRSPSPRRRPGSPSPPRRRSSPRRTPPRSLSPEVSEWETDTEEEEDEVEEKKNDDGKTKEEEEKSKESVKEVKTAEPKKKTETAEDEDGPDDFLKLDATAEVDEFSQFLNEFEDEVLDESKQKEQAAVKMKKEKKERPPTEKKVVDGKKLRKKVKPTRLSPLPMRTRSRSPRGSPMRWQKGGDRRSPGGRYFPDERRGMRGSPGRKRAVQSPGLEKRRSPNGKSRSPEKRSSKSKDRVGAPLKPKETAQERKEREEKEAMEKKEKEEKEYQERLSKLPTPEREIMEARKRKFEARSSVSEGRTKISLKTSQSTPSLALTTKKKMVGDSAKVSGGLISASKRALEEAESVKDEADSMEAKFDTGPKAKSAALKADKFPRVGKESGDLRRGGKASVEEEEEEERGVVTDLRVRLHKKKQEAVAVGKKVVDKKEAEGVEEEADVSSVKRKVVPPGKMLPASRRSDSRSASRSPSPPPQKRKKKLSGDYLKRASNPEEEEDVEDNIGLGGRRIIVARPRSLSPESEVSSSENLQVITANMKKGMKKSLSSRLGPVDPGVQQFSEKEIYEEMLRQQERRRIAIEEKEIRKLKKAMKKKEKLERKLKKHDKKESKKKSKKVLDDDSDFSEGDMLASLDLLKAKQEQLAQAPAKTEVDSDEELYRFFEEPVDHERKEKKGGRHSEEKKKKVGKKRRTSEDEVDGKRSRRSSGESGLRARLGRKVDKKTLEEEDSDQGRSTKSGKRHRKS